jgi:replicative DNA helicase
LLTVSAQLKKNAKLELAGGDFYLIQLTQKISSSAHIEFHSRIILQKFIQRSLIKISSEIIEESYDETTDVLDLLDKAESKLYEVTQGNIKRSSETAQSLVIQAKNASRKLRARKDFLESPRISQPRQDYLGLAAVGFNHHRSASGYG